MLDGLTPPRKLRQYIMARKSTIKLLLINESENEGERLVSLFRNAGRVARARRVKSAEDLQTALNEDSWDLLIANDKHPELSPEQTLEKLAKAETVFPTIILRDSSADIQAIMDAGASDVVAPEDDPRLVFAAFREIQHLENRNQLGSLAASLEEAEQRCELLMAQSQDAIGYVSDGMLISANPLFRGRFDYEDPEELDCLPVIDLIADADHDKFKSLLKAQQAKEDGSTDFEFTGLKEDGSEFSAAMQISNATLDGEACVQLSIRDKVGASSGASSSAATLDHDPATGLYSHDYFLKQLSSYATQAAAGTATTSLLFISIDRFSSIRSKLGLITAEHLIADVARFIQTFTEESNFLAHYCDDSFSLLLQDTGADKARQFADKLCKDLEAHIIEVDGQSTQCTASIGVVLLDKQIGDNTTLLINHAFSACEAVRESGEGGVGNGSQLFVPTHEKKVLDGAQGDNALDTAVEEALEDGQFHLAFQPIISLRGTTGDHYEVSPLMNNEEDGMDPASIFLAKLNFCGVNTRLDRWVLLEATKQLANQRDQGHDIRLFINLTGNSLQDETLLPWLSVAMKAGGLPGEAIVLQFTENDIINYLKPAIAFAKALKNMGCLMAITNYGLSDSPEKHLKAVGAQYTKIDDSYTKSLEGGGDTEAVKAMVTAINEGKAQAIISSVENASAMAVLWQIGVDFIQGSYLAPPSAQMDYEFTDIA